MVTNSEPVDCRGGAEFRYAGYTNDTTTNFTFSAYDEYENLITVNLVFTNYVSETATWTAEFTAEGEYGGTNTFLYEIHYQPKDETDTDISPSLLSFAVDTNNVPIPLDDFWNHHLVVQEGETYGCTPAFDPLVKVAVGAPVVAKVLTQLSLNTDGPFHANNNLGANAQHQALFGVDANGMPIAPRCGPHILHHGAIDAAKGDEYNHVVEIRAEVPGTMPLANVKFLQKSTVARDTVSFADGTILIVAEDLPEEDALPAFQVQKGPGRQMFLTDGPGPNIAGALSYLGANPPPTDGWPEGVAICAFQSYFEFGTILEYSLGAIRAPISDVLKWYVQVQAAAPDQFWVSTAGLL